jgi:hypothetical protein
MEKGTDFLKSQVDNAVAQHHTFLESLKSHAQSADDPRVRALSDRFIPVMTRHHTMLEEYQRSIDAGRAGLKKALGGLFDTAKEWVDAATGDDYMALVQDIVLARQGEDTFKTFREAGRVIGDPRLQLIGEQGEADHDRYVEEANRLVQQVFVERVQVGATARI